MTRIAILAAALMASATPAFAQEPAPPGDTTLSCEALVAERGKLETAEAKRAQRAEAGRRFAGLAGAAFSAAAPSLLARAGSGTGGLAAQGLMGALQSGAMSPPADDSAPAASPEAQRLEQVHAMMTERGC